MSVKFSLIFYLALLYAAIQLPQFYGLVQDSSLFILYNLLYFYQQMGCDASSNKDTVPISKSILHLMHSGNTQLLLKKLKTEDNGIDYNTRCNFRGDTYLHYACSKNNYELAKFFLQHKADPNIQNSQGTLPIDLTKNKEIIAILEKYMQNANKGQKNNQQKVGNIHEGNNQAIANRQRNNEQKYGVAKTGVNPTSTSQSLNTNLKTPESQKNGQESKKNQVKDFRYTQSKIVYQNRQQLQDQNI